MSVLKFAPGLLGAAVAFVSSTAHAAIVLTTPNYFENFDRLISTGTSNVAGGVLPNGWLFSEAGANANTTYTANTGSSNTGDTYSFGAVGSTDRALGGLRSGNLIPTFGAQFTNGLGRAITGFNLGYLGEFYRLGTTGRADQLFFEYSTNATSLTTGTWTRVLALTFNTPNTGGTVGVRDGNVAANQTALSSRIDGLRVLRGQSIFVRFIDFDAPGSDDSLGIDNFRVEDFTLGGVPEPSTWMMMIAGFGFVGVALRRRRKVRAVIA